MRGFVGWLFTAAFTAGTFLFYYSDSPVGGIFGVNQGLAHVIAQGGIYISSTLYVQGHAMFLDSYDGAQEEITTRVNAMVEADRADESGNSSGWLTRLFRYLEGAFLIGIVAFFQYLFLGLLWLVYWICQAQYLWGYVGLSVLALLGPVFIPFLLFSQTDWLFWGWAKGLVQCAVHMIVSATVFVFVAVLMVLPLNRLLGVDTPGAPTSFAGAGEYLAMFVEFIPSIVMGLLGSVAVGSIAGQLTSGTAPAAAGLMHRASQLVAHGASATSPFVGVGRGGPVPQSMQTLAPGGKAPGAHPSQSAAAGAVLAARQGLRPSAGVGAPATGSPGPGAKAPVLASGLALRQARQVLDPALNKFERGEMSPHAFRTLYTQTMGKLASASKLDTKRVSKAFVETVGPQSRMDRLYGSSRRARETWRASRTSDPGPQPT